MPKKIICLLAILCGIISFFGIASADGTILIKINGGLKNEVVNAFYTKRNTIKGETNMRPKVKSYMSNIRNISENATGGIRVRTVAKRKCNGKTKEYVKYDIVRMGNTTSESDPFLFDDFLECSTQISWQNYTGNTRFDAYFIAEQ